MKTLIWVGTFVVAVVIQTLLRALLQNGAVPFIPGTFVIYLVATFVARKLCRKWDERN